MSAHHERVAERFEGVETGLAVMEATGTPTWAAGDAGCLQRIAIPVKVRHVEIWADHDEESGTGQKAATALAERLIGEGRTVRVMIPETPGDWLDVYAKGNGKNLWALRLARREAESLTTLEDLWSSKSFMSSKAKDRFGSNNGDMSFMSYTESENAQASATASESSSQEQPGTTKTTDTTKGWPPPLAPEAYHGLAGAIVRTIAPHTEADPAALLMQFLVAFGNAIGRYAYFTAESDHHHTNLYAVLVGETSKARKGSSWGWVRRLFHEAAPDWTGTIRSGLSSGEGRLAAVRDGKEPEPATTPDKRCLVMEPEFATALTVMTREGNILSPKVRQAWDTGDLATLTRHDPLTATGAHVSLVGHITRAELLRMLDRTEMANGFANRILWVCIRRSKCLPDGGNLPDEALAPLAERLKDVIARARYIDAMGRSLGARAVWHAVYEPLSDGKPGLLGAVLSRAEAQIMRLATIYALLDGEDEIDRRHLLAALAVCDFCEASARYIFGDALGDPIADEILRALRAAPAGMTRTQIRDLFGRNVSTDRIGRGLGLLLERGLAAPEPEQTGGRPAERWRARPLHMTTGGWPYLNLAKSAVDPEIVGGVPDSDPGETKGGATLH